MKCTDGLKNVNSASAGYNNVFFSRTAASRSLTHHTTSSASVMFAPETYLTASTVFSNPIHATKNMFPQFCPFPCVKQTPFGAQIFTRSRTWHQIKQWPVITFHLPICAGLEHSRSTPIGVTTLTVATCRPRIPVPNLMKDTRYIFYDANIGARNVKQLIWLHDSIL
jgi:hypothetical protein